MSAVFFVTFVELLTLVLTTHAAFQILCLSFKDPSLLHRAPSTAAASPALNGVGTHSSSPKFHLLLRRIGTVNASCSVLLGPDILCLVGITLIGLHLFYYMSILSDFPQADLCSR